MVRALAPAEGEDIWTTLFHGPKNYRVGSQPTSGSIVVGCYELTGRQQMQNSTSPIRPLDVERRMPWQLKIEITDDRRREFI